MKSDSQRVPSDQIANEIRVQVESSIDSNDHNDSNNHAENRQSIRRFRKATGRVVGRSARGSRAAIFATSAMLCGIVSASALADTPPVAAYDFNQGSGTTLQDLSGNANAGTLINGPTWSQGKYSGALTFDGANDYVRMADIAATDGLTSITVSAWVKFSSAGDGASEMHLVDKSQCNQHQGGGPWELGVSLSQSHKAEFVITPLNGWPVSSGPSLTSIDDGNWHFIAGTYDGNQLSIWVDGAAENSANAPGVTMSNTRSRVELAGHCNGYAPHPFRGSLDDVRIYTRALASAEMQSDMNTPLSNASAPPPPPPATLSADSTAPSITIDTPTTGATVSGTVTVSATATDNVGVVGVRFFVNGNALGAEDTSAPFAVSWDTTTGINGWYTLSAVARDAAGNQSQVTTRSAQVSNTAGGGGGGGGDTTAPSVPSSLRSSNVTTNSVGLAWTGSTDNVGVTGYRVYRNGSSIGTSSTASFNDSGLSPSTSYTYTVAAFDAAGNTSAQSSGLVVTTASSPTPDTTPPSAPANLRSTSATTSQISLAWNASTDNVGVTGYRVYRNGGQIGSPTTTTFTDSGLAANTGYVYTVYAVDAAGNVSASSSPLSASTSAASSGGTYSTNFDLTENPISEGGKWHRASNAWTNVRTSGGLAYGTNGASNGYDDSYALLSGFGANQGAEATIVRSPSLATGISHEIELLLRFSDDANNARGYEVLFAYYGAIQVVRWNGPLGDFTVLNVSGGPGNLGREFVTGDVIKATMVGSTIKIYVNGVFMGQASDSVFSTGQPGISFFTRPGGNSANYAITNYSAYPAN